MKNRSLIIAAMILIPVWLCGFNSVAAQTNPKPSTFRSVSWGDEELTTEVYLVHKRSVKGNYSLLVISEKDLKIFYRTEINSSQPVSRELLPVKTVGDRKYYEFDHHFSRTTIWMALEFKSGGKRVEGLTRSFYNDIFEIVPNDQFLDRFPAFARGR